MKNIVYRLWVFVAAMVLSTSASYVCAQMGSPIIVAHSDAYTEVGEGNQFSMFISGTVAGTYIIEMGGAEYSFQVVPGSIDTEAGTWTGTWIPISVNEGGSIRIFGNGANIDVLSIDGGYLTDIDISGCPNLEVLSLQHNTLKNLDLTDFSKLTALYLGDNPFDGENSLVVGPNKPNLSILELDIIDNMARGFNLSDYPSMMVFDAYHNLALKEIDTSGCPMLLSLSLEMTGVGELDLSNNPYLQHLNIAETRITDIDLSCVPKLNMLLAGHDSGWINTGCKLNSIDLTHNPLLTYVHLNGNHLGHIDLSQNTKITNLSLKRNDLTSIDLSNLTELYSVNLSFNELDFATLPFQGEYWGEYYYQQNPMELPRAIGKGVEVDMSARVLREGTTTVCSAVAAPVEADPYVLPETEYSYADGKFVFNTIPEDSVYMVFQNSAFPDYAMTTSTFKVKEAGEVGQPSRIVNMNVEMPLSGNLRLAVGMGGATAATPKSFIVEFAPGNCMEFQSTYSDEPTSYNVDIAAPAGFTGSVNILVPEEEVMTSLAIENMPLASIDLTAATELRRLSLVGTDLAEIDLRYNRCLEFLDLSYNSLSQLDLTGIYGGYSKNMLTTVIAAHNNLSGTDGFKYNDTATFRHVDLSYNNFENFKLLEFENLEYIDLSHNQLSEELYLTYQITARHIDLSGNNLPSVVIDTFENLDVLDLSGNKLSIATLPLAGDLGICRNYLYAPQQPLQISQIGCQADISDQDRVINGWGTNFKWYKADGTPLVEGQDLICVDGMTSFLSYTLGPIYCTMSNPAFPDLTGRNIYRTTEIIPQSTPTQLVATFKTSKTASDGVITLAAKQRTDVYIDWRGDGQGLTPYPVETSYISYSGQKTYNGSTVKIYSYDDPEIITVFSTTNIKMSEADLSPLTGAFCVSLSRAGISQDKLTLAPTAPITELTLDNCNLTAFPWSNTYPTIDMLVLNNNNLSEFDATGITNLGNLMLRGNQIRSLSFNNPRLWNLDLANNGMESLALSGVPALEQLDLSNNALSSIDLTAAAETLHYVNLVENKFTFATLPLQADFAALNVYYYGNQAAIDVQCYDGQVDLSDNASVNGTASVYAWYVGTPVYDYNTYSWTGEQLEEGVDYVIDNGVTTFYSKLNETVTCLITNEVFPNLTLKTKPILISSTGLDEVLSGESFVDVYSLSGVLLRAAVPAAKATVGLEPGLYIVGNRKVIVR